VARTIGGRLGHATSGRPAAEAGSADVRTVVVAVPDVVVVVAAAVAAAAAAAAVASVSAVAEAAVAPVAPSESLAEGPEPSTEFHMQAAPPGDPSDDPAPPRPHWPARSTQPADPPASLPHPDCSPCESYQRPRPGRPRSVPPEGERFPV
jgi:hypothetical protein